MRDLDMLKPFESVKKMKRRGEWQCTRCNKLFRGEDFVSSEDMDCCATRESHLTAGMFAAGPYMRKLVVLSNL